MFLRPSEVMIRLCSSLYTPRGDRAGPFIEQRACDGAVFASPVHAHTASMSDASCNAYDAEKSDRDANVSGVQASQLLRQIPNFESLLHNEPHPNALRPNALRQSLLQRVCFELLYKPPDACLAGVVLRYYIISVVQRLL